MQLDVLVNNAGRSQRANWEDIDLAVDKEMFDLNVFSILSLSRIALHYFMKQNKGHIVVTSSLTGVTPIPYSASYTGAKHAIHVSLYLILNNILVVWRGPAHQKEVIQYKIRLLEESKTAFVSEDKF